MVNYQTDPLNRVFAALADPTRRALLARLGQQESLSISELAQPFTLSLPAVMKHLDVLSDAGLIAPRQTGRSVACRLTRRRWRTMGWLNNYGVSGPHGSRLAAFLEEDDSCRPKQPANQTLRSRAKLDPAGKVFAAGPTRENGAGWARGRRAATRRDRRASLFIDLSCLTRRRGTRRQRRLPRGRAEQKLVFSWAGSHA